MINIVALCNKQTANFSNAPCQHVKYWKHYDLNCNMLASMWWILYIQFLYPLAPANVLNKHIYVPKEVTG